MACSLMACSGGAEAPEASAAKNVEIELTAVPANVSKVVMAASPDFKMAEVVKKVRDGRTYYDVEGELPSGEEIEFDVLMTDKGPKVVEIQRDIALKAAPRPVRRAVRKANTKKLKVVRVIESKQAESNEIVYEIFVDGKPETPYFEVSRTGKGPAEVLTKPSKH